MEEEAEVEEVVVVLEVVEEDEGRGDGEEGISPKVLSGSAMAT